MAALVEPGDRAAQVELKGMRDDRKMGSGTVEDWLLLQVGGRRGWNTCDG